MLQVKHKVWGVLLEYLFMCRLICFLINTQLAKKHNFMLKISASADNTIIHLHGDTTGSS